MFAQQPHWLNQWRDPFDQPMEDEGNIQDSRDLLKTLISGASKHVLDMVW